MKNDNSEYDVPSVTEAQIKYAMAVSIQEGGAEVQIISGYRDAAHNAKVGGAPRSAHLTSGLAMDIRINGFTKWQTADAVIKSNLWIRGSVYEHNGVHVDNNYNALGHTIGYMWKPGTRYNGKYYSSWRRTYKRM